MITFYFLLTISTIIGVIFIAFPTVTVLPFGMDAILVTAVSYLHYFIQIFPLFGIVFNAFLIYLGFRVTLLTLHLFKII